ncbi:hypothetical protein DPEC_G00249460 [Dallia pectoralis]|uniref:Uncharacterized protein n=1 Tax=Dallia pectoralis TaxID=75939 RepID=A0ACC2FT39_DALPE|nr:hypothetical protein DPEC_G00249460 [Dallia pectoralis]
MMDSDQSMPDVITDRFFNSTWRSPSNQTQPSMSTSTIPVVYHSSFHNALLGVVLGFLSLLTIFMNILVLYAVKKERTLHTVGNLYIVSLSVADLIVGATVMPLNLVYLLEDEWKLGRVVCQFWLIMDYVASTASIFSLFILCLDRYRSVHEPLKYLKYRTRGRASAMISGAWLLSMLWIIPILGWRSFAQVDRKPEMDNKCDTDFRFVTWFKVLASVFNFYVPSVLMLWFYSRIYMAVRQHFREREKIINPTDSGAEHRTEHQVQIGNPPCRSSKKQKKERRSDFDQYTLDQPYSSTDTAETNAPRELKKNSLCHSFVKVTKHSKKAVKNKKKTSSLSSQKNCSDSESPLKLSSLARGYTHADDNNVPKCYISVSDCDIAESPHSGVGVCQITRIADVEKHTITLCNDDLARSLRSPSSQWPQGEAENVAGVTPGTEANAVTLKQTWQRFCAQSCERIQGLQVHKEHKAAKQLGCIIAGFMMCWIPYFIAFMVMAFCQTCVHHDLHMFTIWLGVHFGTSDVVSHDLNKEARFIWYRL